MSLQIRRATLADVDALSAIAITTYNETWGDSYPAQELQDFRTTAANRSAPNCPTRAARSGC